MRELLTVKVSVISAIIPALGTLSQCSFVLALPQVLFSVQLKDVEIDSKQLLIPTNSQFPRAIILRPLSVPAWQTHPRSSSLEGMQGPLGWRIEILSGLDSADESMFGIHISGLSCSRSVGFSSPEMPLPDVIVQAMRL